MSSILDALGKLESSSTGGPGGPPPPRPRRWIPVVIGVALVAFVAGGLAVRYLGADDTPVMVAEVPVESRTPQARPEGRAVVEQPATTLPVAPAAPTAPPARAARAATEPKKDAAPTFHAKPLPKDAEPRSAAAPRPGARPAATRPRPTTTRQVPRRRPTTTESSKTPPEPTATPPSTAPRPPAPPSTAPRPPAPPSTAPRPPAPPSTTPPPRPPVGRRPAGAPDVRVSFLMYSSLPERRSVALRLEGAGISNLREGEYFQGVRVVEIFPDAVDLEWGGVRYRVPARR